MSQTHDLIFSLEHAAKGGKRNLVGKSKTPHAGRLAFPSDDSEFEDSDFDDEAITGLTAKEVKQSLREAREYGKDKKGK